MKNEKKKRKMKQERKRDVKNLYANVPLDGEAPVISLEGENR